MDWKDFFRFNSETLGDEYLCPKCYGKDFYFYDQYQMRGIGTGLRQVTKKRKICKNCDLVMGRKIKSGKEKFQRSLKILIPEFVWFILGLFILIIIGFFLDLIL